MLQSSERIELLKENAAEGHWKFEKLGYRLMEKHSRAVFIKAETKIVGGIERFRYDDLLYCESPSIAKFMQLVESKGIVFEFTMAEKENGTVRNHGYPWRLIREEMLSNLFGLQVKLR